MVRPAARNQSSASSERPTPEERSNWMLSEIKYVNPPSKLLAGPASLPVGISPKNSTKTA